jgi:cobalt-zinc-cadmium efflux system outer membrane protein
LLPILFAITVSHTFENPLRLAELTSARSQVPLTSDEAVRTMLQSHPRIQAAMLEVRSSMRGVASARSLANTEITVSPGFTSAGSDEELLIAQPLEINGVRAARTGVASAAREATRAKGRIEAAELVQRTRLAFAEALRTRARLKVAEELVETASELDRIARRQVELGTRAGIEQSQTNIELIRARQHATLAEAEWTSAEAELKMLMGVKPSEPLVLAQTDALQPVPEELALLAEALKRRPELALVESEQRTQLQEARLARAEGLPDLSSHFRMERFTREPRDLGFGVSISIPIFDFGSRRNRIAQAELAAEAHARRRAGVEAEIRQEVTKSLAQLRASEAVLGQYQGGLLDEATKLYEATQRGFQLGQSNITALLEAQRTYRAVQIEFTEARFSQAKAAAHLERASGSLPEDSLPVELKRQAKKR